MIKEKNNILLVILISFSLYCAFTVGETWDQKDNIIRGKITLDYLFSLGRIDEHIFARENYSTIYWSLIYFITEIFPQHLEIHITNLINLFFSLCTIFGIKKLCKELFNNNVGKITFIILFFYPIFFGHTSFNTKDTILAFGHVWMTYLLLRYLKKQYILKKRNKYIFYLGLLAAMCSGIQLVFLGSMIPFIIFLFAEIFIFKKIVNINFNIKKLIYDVIKCFLLFYLILVIFWIDTHPNILILPYRFIIETFSNNFWTGWQYNLLNGYYFLSNETPKTYFFTYLFFKSPEYFLISYLFFIIFYFASNRFFKKEFSYFNYKLILILAILLYPNLVLLIVPYPVYDGIRLFLWALPYFSILPGLAIYYLFKNFNYLSSKIYSMIIFMLAILFLYNFFIITPYQYAYSNIFAGANKNKFNKFENDYWGSSIRELIYKSKFKDNEIIKISTCGINHKIANKYFKRRGYLSIDFVHPEESKYMIMTNRTLLNKETGKISNCFNVYKGIDIFKVERNELILSVVRKIN